MEYTHKNKSERDEKNEKKVREVREVTDNVEKQKESEDDKQHHENIEKVKGDNQDRGDIDLQHKDEKSKQSQESVKEQEQGHQVKDEKEKEKEQEQEQAEGEKEEEKLNFEKINIIDWTNDDTKEWIDFKKSNGTQKDKESNIKDLENRNGISLLEISKSKDTFKSYAGESKHDRAFASLLFDDLKERIDHFSKQKLKRDIINRVVIIRILKKKYMWSKDLSFGTGLRVGRNLIFTSAHILTGVKEGQLLEVGFDGRWFRANVLCTTEFEDPLVDCGLLQIKDLEEKYHCDTYPISKKPYDLLREIICCSFPYSRLPLVSPSDYKNFGNVKPPEPSIFSGRSTYVDQDILEIHISGDAGVCKGGLIFNLNCGELCGIIRKQNRDPSLSNVLYCTKLSSITAWVNTSLKKLQQPPLWE